MASAGFLTATAKGRAISWTTVKAAQAVNDTPLLIRVLSSAYDLCVERIKVWVDSACEITIHTPTDSATALVGTAVTGKALDRDWSDTTLAESKGDETAMAQGTIVEKDYLTANETKYFPYEGSLVISLGKSIGVDCVHACDAIVTIWGYFKVPSQ